ncbi:MAG TPA: maleylpyruvate isomerase N-terminal domain-containing protein [Vicinamibacterales bacterium]|nr:maleylpyruvate isomerase N-terminal domain-containing protein [Vicinamibacterales bacterium]
MQPLAPRYVSDLFRPLLGELLALLRGFGQDDWERPTVAGPWRVRDVAAHLLDGDLRKIAVYRDDHRLPLDAPITSDRDLARFINGLNATGVAYAARLSPRLITDLLEITGGWVAQVIEDLPPHAPARFPVSWAGESRSENWMDTGREYTERWHHQAQLRDATGSPRLLAPRWLEPLLDFSVRVLPHAYAGVHALPKTAIALRVEGETVAVWSVVRDETSWKMFRGEPADPAAIVQVDSDDVWRLFYNALTSDAMRARLRIDGDAALAAPLLRARSVIL